MTHRCGEDLCVADWFLADRAGLKVSAVILSVIGRSGRDGGNHC